MNILELVKTAKFCHEMLQITENLFVLISLRRGETYCIRDTQFAKVKRHYFLYILRHFMPKLIFFTMSGKFQLYKAIVN